MHGNSPVYIPVDGCATPYAQPSIPTQESPFVIWEMEPEPRKLLDQVRDALRLKHYSIRTEQAYVNWTRRFIFFHHKRHSRDMGVPEVEAFLSYLAVDERVAASTQNQALSALLFLYREVLHQNLRPVDALRDQKPGACPPS